MSGSGRSGPSRPVSPWTSAAVLSSPPAAGDGRARGDRHVADAGQRADAQRVARDGLERPVAADGGDRAQVGERAAGCEEDRERVVVAGIAVEDERSGHGAGRSSQRRAARATSSAHASMSIAVASSTSA